MEKAFRTPVEVLKINNTSLRNVMKQVHLRYGQGGKGEKLELQFLLFIVCHKNQHCYEDMLRPPLSENRARYTLLKGAVVQILQPNGSNCLEP